MSVPHYFLDFCVCSDLKNKFTNEFSRCRTECKHSVAPKYRSEIAFQASVLFLLGFETNVGISIDVVVFFLPRMGYFGIVFGIEKSSHICI